MKYAYDSQDILHYFEKLVNVPSPVGYYVQMNQVISQLADELGQMVWFDNKSTAYIVQAVLQNIKAGDIILMHDYIGYNSKTPEALEQIIPKLLAEGYEFVTVSDLVRKR